MLRFSESLYHELTGTGISPIAVRTNFFKNESFGCKVKNYTGIALDAKVV